jgi:hypothetical protein
VLSLGGVDNSAIGQDNFEIQNVVGSPAILGAQEAHATCNSLDQKDQYRSQFSQSHTAEHVAANSDSTQATSNNSPASSIKTLLGIFPCKTRTDNGSVVLRVIVNLVQVLSRNQQSVLDASKSIVGHVSSTLDGTF